MANRRVIIGDKEYEIPEKILSLGVVPILGIALLIWLGTGIYIVGPDEVGVVQRFGDVNRVAQSGLRYHFPFPIETVKSA